MRHSLATQYVTACPSIYSECAIAWQHFEAQGQPQGLNSAILVGVGRGLGLFVVRIGQAAWFAFGFRLGFRVRIVRFSVGSFGIRVGYRSGVVWFSFAFGVRVGYPIRIVRHSVSTFRIRAGFRIGAIRLSLWP